MHIQSRFILTIAALAFALASGLPKEVSADELKEAKVTQVIQDVRVLPSNASPRPAAVNDNVRQGTAVQTGVQSRSELTFKDQTITPLARRLFLAWAKSREPLILAAANFCCVCRRKRVAQKLRLGPLRQRSPGKKVSCEPGLSGDSKIRSSHLGARGVLGNHR